MPYLILLGALIFVGALVVWLSERFQRRPETPQSSIENFARRMQALQPRISGHSGDMEALEAGPVEEGS